MELHANWVEISGGVWSRLTQGWACAPGLGLLPPMALRLVLWLLVPGFFPSLHQPIHPWITLSDQQTAFLFLCALPLLPCLFVFLSFHRCLYLFSSFLNTRFINFLISIVCIVLPHDIHLMYHRSTVYFCLYFFSHKDH